MINLISGIIIVLGIMAFRKLWVQYNVERYSFYSLHYLTMNSNLEDKIGVEMAELWPPQYLYWELWNWNFKRYIIHLDHYEKMKDFMEQQLKRTDLTLEIFQKEFNEINKEVKEIKDDSG